MVWRLSARTLVSSSRGSFTPRGRNLARRFGSTDERTKLEYPSLQGKNLSCTNQHTQPAHVERVRDDGRVAAAECPLD